jgi:hypothetical protein
VCNSCVTRPLKHSQRGKTATPLNNNEPREIMVLAVAMLCRVAIPLDLKSLGASHTGSIPVPGTKHRRRFLAAASPLYWTT